MSHLRQDASEDLVRECRVCTKKFEARRYKNAESARRARRNHMFDRHMEESFLRSNASPALKVTEMMAQGSETPSLPPGILPVYHCPHYAFDAQNYDSLGIWVVRHLRATNTGEFHWVELAEGWAGCVSAETPMLRVSSGFTDDIS
eukprot:TRINITY_DN3687_c0_g4_i4.p1 TRINITY_DN3687_c0_g4~~TRINITY_DN3687_c0_g4_i4.p1  ORF type:complete len:146 (-),score=5.13 TRINITY_DN3687_c0_g4_i4:323-760(-)